MPNQKQSYDGTDYVCANCGCEIMVKHSGDPAKMSADSTYTCRCGTRMQLEHAPTGATVSS
jgi:DNA-directed RNA polymerase subunit RPC12/RpoP